MNISPIINPRIFTNHKTNLYPSRLSHQTVNSMENKITDIFTMESEWGFYVPGREKIKAVLDKYSHLDLNAKDENGETIFSRALRQHTFLFNALVDMESRGEIDGIDWNMKNNDGDNLLMILAKEEVMFHPCDYAIVELANKGKIDVNYVNTKSGYSLPQCFLLHSKDSFPILFGLKDIDLSKIVQTGINNESIPKLAIKNGLASFDFLNLIKHPSINFNQHSLNDLHNFINNAPLSSQEKREYSKAIKAGVKTKINK